MKHKFKSSGKLKIKTEVWSVLKSAVVKTNSFK